MTHDTTGRVDRRTVLKATGAAGFGTVAAGVAAASGGEEVHLAEVGVEYDLDVTEATASELQRTAVHVPLRYVVGEGTVSPTELASEGLRATFRDRDRVVAVAGEVEALPTTVALPASSRLLPVRVADDYRPTGAVSVTGRVPEPTVDLRFDGTGLGARVDGTEHAVEPGAARTLPAAGGEVAVATWSDEDRPVTVTAEPHVHVRNRGSLVLVE